MWVDTDQAYLFNALKVNAYGLFRLELTKEKKSGLFAVWHDT